MTAPVKVGPPKALILAVTRWPNIVSSSPELADHLGRGLEKYVFWLSKTLANYCGYEHIEVHLSPPISPESAMIIKRLPEGTSVHSEFPLTKSTIKSQLKEFSTTCRTEKPKQTFVLLCSHGFASAYGETSYFFCPEDGKMTQSEQPDPSTMLSVLEIWGLLHSVTPQQEQQKSGGTKCLIVIDSCYSG